uniref:Putative GIY YIG homing endonuclease n=1 Tax=Haematococcus lacustris TaxID=44745 RepID=A0A0S2IDC7_HAELA|nr:putative GIY YIG homing endonuclease [Haematococcus lacustris]
MDTEQIDTEQIDTELIDTDLIISKQSVDQLNSMRRIIPKKNPGLYMIRCKKNDKRYYGETKNVQGRLASHKSYLTRNIHPNALMQHDWNTYGQENFEFTTLFMGVEWVNYQSRIDKETLLIVQDGKLCYNYLLGNKKPGEKNPFYGKQHSEETKKRIGLAMKGIPNELLGRSIKLLGEVYTSIAEASRQTGMARKTIRKRLNDVNDPSCIEINNNK